MTCSITVHRMHGFFSLYSLFNNIQYVAEFSFVHEFNILENESSLLEELKAKQFYKITRSLFFSAYVIRYPLYLIYTSLQACKLFLNKFPIPPIFFLNKIQEGNVDAMKSPNVLKIKHTISEACIIVIIEMHLLA